jgi:hypothetical protein
MSKKIKLGKVIKALPTGATRAGLDHKATVDSYDYHWGVDIKAELESLIDGTKIAVVLSGVAELIRICIPNTTVHRGSGVDESIRILTKGNVFGLFEWSRKSGPEKYKDALRNEELDDWAIYSGLATVSSFDFLSATTKAHRESAKTALGTELISEFPLRRWVVGTSEPERTSIAILDINIFDDSWLLGTFFKQYDFFGLSSMRFRQSYRYARMPNKSFISRLDCGKDVDKAVIVPIFLDIIFRTLHSLNHAEVAYKRVSLKDIKNVSGMPSLANKEINDYLISRGISELAVPIKIRDYAGGDLVKEVGVGKDLYFPFSVRSPFAADAYYKIGLSNAAKFDKDIFKGVKHVFDTASSKLEDFCSDNINDFIIKVFMEVRKNGDVSKKPWAYRLGDFNDIKKGWIKYISYKSHPKR